MLPGQNLVLSTRIELVMAGYQPTVIPFNYKRKFGSNGEIRTHTLLRMKEVHNHYATLPYRNTLVGNDLETYLPTVTKASNVFLYGRGTGTRTLIDRLKAGYSSL